ncbi:hypothetical protein CC79DRAFT_1354579 [Sarocladium strictum]
MPSSKSPLRELALSFDKSINVLLYSLSIILAVLYCLMNSLRAEPLLRAPCPVQCLGRGRYYALQLLIVMRPNAGFADGERA